MAASDEVATASSRLTWAQWMWRQVFGKELDRLEWGTWTWSREELEGWRAGINQLLLGQQFLASAGYFLVVRHLLPTAGLIYLVTTAMGGFGLALIAAATPVILSPAQGLGTKLWLLVKVLIGAVVYSVVGWTLLVLWLLWAYFSSL